MAKTTSKAVEVNESSADSARLKQALDSLDLVDSELDQFEWMRRVTERVGDDIAAEWSGLALGAGDFEREYEFNCSLSLILVLLDRTNER